MIRKGCCGPNRQAMEESSIRTAAVSDGADIFYREFTGDETRHLRDTISVNGVPSKQASSCRDRHALLLAAPLSAEPGGQIPPPRRDKGPCAR